MCSLSESLGVARGSDAIGTALLTVEMPVEVPHGFKGSYCFFVLLKGFLGVLLAFWGGFLWLQV